MSRYEDAWCAFCCRRIQLEGKTYKQEMPERAVTKVDGTPVCNDHLIAAIDRKNDVPSLVTKGGGLQT